MTQERTVLIENKEYGVIISDEREALLAAEAAGKASIGILGQGSQWLPCRYLAESLQDIDRKYLERVVRRKYGIPWVIAETDRLVIREFQPGDERAVPSEPEDGESDRIFQNQELLREYIRCQYGFYEFGIWALVEKESGKLVGKAGVFTYVPEKNALETWYAGKEEEALELGYHIFAPYRRLGYGKEACTAILTYVRETMGYRVYAKTDASNEASVKLMKSLGFRFVTEKYSEEGQCRCLYCWN